MASDLTYKQVLDIISKYQLERESTDYQLSDDPRIHKAIVEGYKLSIGIRRNSRKAKTTIWQFLFHVNNARVTEGNFLDLLNLIEQIKVSRDHLDHTSQEHGISLDI